ncbi:MAG: OmpA family protein [Bacteroidales bacterium]|nr:OmpA family protein [Bacteroidales bacterium]
MKGIKTILGAVAIATLLSFSANAQENNNRDEEGNIVRGSYLTNGFWSNWFIGVGGGINAGIRDLSPFDLAGKAGVAVDANVGKWFTPTVGARVGWKGIKNANGGKFNEFNQNFYHADFLWNFSNSVSGYKETRFWDLIPYATVGVNHVKITGNDYEYAAGIGLLNDFRLGNHVDLFIDLSALVAHGRQYKESNKFWFPVSATAGLIFNLGKTNWDRYSSVAPVVVPVPFTVDQYNALKDKVAALEAENASLKNKIAALEAEKNARKYTEGQLYTYKNGQFVETEATISTPATLYFDLGKSTLSQREIAHLEFFANTALVNANKVTVTGSADSKTGSAKYNQKLSEKRAAYVKDLLVKKFGVAEDKISTTGIGGVDNFNTPAKNRVAIVEAE